MRRFAFLLLVALAVGSQQPLSVTPFHSNGIYKAGETAGWTVTGPEGRYAYVVKKNNAETVKTGEIDLATGPARIEVSLNEPAMLLMQLTPTGGKPIGYGFGAAVEPTKIKPALPKPKDFDAFWKERIKELQAIPENAVLTPGESGRAGVDYWTIRMDHVNGTHVYGQMARPSKPGKYPAILQLQWASPPYPLQRSWIVDRAAQGYLVLNIEPHDVLPTEPASYYQGLPEKLRRYEGNGPSYFVEMYLRDYRAVEYLAKRPDWNGKTLIAMGTSMGGQQSLAVAGLNPKITHVIVNEPAGCDLSGAGGRQVGYPFFGARPDAGYVDCVNLAGRIKATSLVAMGFTDTIAPPAGIWAAFNEIKGPKEAAPMFDSPHNNLATPEQQRPFTSRSEVWLAALARGEKIMEPSRADQPSPRTDANSREAHRQLVEKARQGNIDLYFVGDSITRRWGTSDAQYRDFYKNWIENFYGWNAGNFGWGGDTTQNILWRLQNGELDGVHPKVVVVLAGTNNLGSFSGGEIVQGVRAIVDLCRHKAPNATVILTGIFPRDDRPGLMPTISEINGKLATFADGKRVRFLNVNDRMADPNGKLFGGMTVDGLHLSLQGYQVWADGLRPLLTELLGPPAKLDKAPAPTGDPGIKDF